MTYIQRVVVLWDKNVRNLLGHKLRDKPPVSYLFRETLLPTFVCRQDGLEFLQRKTSLKRTVIRENSVFLSLVFQFRGLFGTSRLSRQYGTEGFQCLSSIGHSFID